MLQRIDWNSRLVGIIGPRGIGKSTMILQHIIRNQEDGHHLYVSADNIYFLNHRLATFADEFVKDGGTHLYIDEIYTNTRTGPRN
jgi:predicted AAA+ superfamily ATPase